MFGERQQRAGGERGRFSSKREAEAVLRLFRGEELDALSRELTIDNECLRALLRNDEERDPLAQRRSKP
jgi:hypothetical protein